MSRANNASGRYLAMTDDEYARYQASFERACERQREKDAEAAHPYAHKGITIDHCPACRRRDRKAATA